MESHKNKLPSAWVSGLPLAVVTLFLYVVIRCFGGDAINGGSQIALLSATSVCVMLSIGIYRCKWSVLEDAIIDNIRASASAIIILLLIGAIGVIETARPVDMAALQRFFVDQGVWIRPFGRLLYLMPPYIIEPDDLSRLTAALLRPPAGTV